MATRSLPTRQILSSEAVEAAKYPKIILAEQRQRFLFSPPEALWGGRARARETPRSPHAHP